MKTLLIALAVSATSLSAIAQSDANDFSRPDGYKGYVTPVVTVYESRYFMYDHTTPSKDNPSNLYLTDRVTYHLEYDNLYNAANGTTFAAPGLVVKSRVATRVVFMPDCIQSLLAQQYGVSKKHKATVVRTADQHVYYEVAVGGKDYRFDDMCNVNLMGPGK